MSGRVRWEGLVFYLFIKKNLVGGVGLVAADTAEVDCKNVGPADWESGTCVSASSTSCAKILDATETVRQEKILAATGRNSNDMLCESVIYVL